MEQPFVMPTGFNPSSPMQPVRGALSGGPQAPAIAPGMHPAPAPPLGMPGAPAPQGAAPSPPMQGAPGAMPPQGPQMPTGGLPPQGGPMPPPGAGTPPAAPGGPSSNLSSADSLISRVLRLMKPPPPPPPAPPAQPPMGGMGMGGMGMPPMQGGGVAAPPGGGDPRAQIMQLLAMSGQGGGGPQMPPGGGQPPVRMMRGGYPFDYLSTRPGLPLRGFAMGGPAFGPIVSPQMFARGDFVPQTGRGDGRSDHVPAKLSPGEYVMDAETVALLGNGDNTAGARRLDAMRKNLREQKGKALAKGRFSPNAKPPESYLPKRGRA